MSDDTVLNLTVKAKGKGKSGLEVELGDDGHYYVKKVPKGLKGCAVGDRVLEINGVTFPRFNGEKHANDLIDTFQLEVVPLDEDDEDDDDDDDDDDDSGESGEESEYVSPSTAKSAAKAASNAAANSASKKSTGRNDGKDSAAKKGGGRGGQNGDDDVDDEDPDEEDYEAVTRPRPGDRSKKGSQQGKNGRSVTHDDGDDDDDDETNEEVSRPRGGGEGGGKGSANGKDRKDGSQNVPASTRVEDCEVNENGEYDEDERYSDEEHASYNDDEDEDGSQPRKPVSENSLKHSMARRRDSKKSVRPEGDWDRPYTSDYVPKDRWMVTVKKGADEDTGLSIVQHKKELFVADVDRGPFFKTAADKGDKILSINGKKVPKHIKSVTQAEESMEGREKLTLFLERPDPEKDIGYKWVMENV